MQRPTFPSNATRQDFKGGESPAFALTEPADDSKLFLG
jgi:hypothetical protein